MSSTSLPELRRIFRFTETDLIENKRGKLSISQQHYLRYRSLFQLIRTVIIGGFLIGLSVLVAITNPAEASRVNIFTAIICLLVIMAVLLELLQLSRVHQGEVAVITGGAVLVDEMGKTQVNKTKTQTGTYLVIKPANTSPLYSIIGLGWQLLLLILWRSLSRSYLLRVGSTSFRINRQAYHAFTTGAVYQIYTLGSTHQIVAVEILRS
jgi:hypothetical protein